MRLNPAEGRSRAIEAAFTLPELYAGLDLDVSLATGPSGTPGPVVDIVIHLPTDQILYLPEAGRRMARLTVGIVAVDESGRETLRVARDVRVALLANRAAGPSLGLNFVARVRLPGQSRAITSVISDRTAGTTAAARLQVDPESAHA